MSDLEALAGFAAELADAARAETLPRWRGAGEARNKSDGMAGSARFDPVTEADIAAEKAMRALIERRFPGHGIAGEEFADREASEPFTWSLDPIDGTRSFVCGMPTWVTLIGLLEQGTPVLGLIDAPRLGERYLGFGKTALLEDANGRHPLRVSGCTGVADARFSSTDPYMFKGPDADRFERVRSRTRTTRFGHDGYAYARLAAGSIDLVIEAGLQTYDYQALIPLIRAAGGVVGNWRGEDDLREGRIVAAATEQLFEEAVGLLKEG